MQKKSVNLSILDMKQNNQFNLINTTMFLSNYIVKHRLDVIEYDDFTKSYEIDGNIDNICTKYQIDILPYMYILCRISKNDLNAFTRYLITYLIKSNMISDYNYKDIFKIMEMDIEYLIAVIICMQYYF